MPGDVALVVGAYRDGELAGLVVVSARWPGFDEVPARALDRFGEGLVVPPTPIAADGDVDREVLELLQATSATLTAWSWRSGSSWRRPPGRRASSTLRSSTRRWLEVSASCARPCARSMAAGWTAISR